MEKSKAKSKYSKYFGTKTLNTKIFAWKDVSEKNENRIWKAELLRRIV